MFDGSEYKNELLERSKPYHIKPFPIPKNIQRSSKRLIN